MVKKLVDRLPDILLAVLVAFSMTYAITSSMCLTYPPVSMLLVIALITAVLYVCFYSRKTSIATGIVSGTAFVCLSVYVLFFVDHEKLLEFIDDYSYWLYDFIMYPDVPQPLYQSITVTALCLAFSVFSLIFVIKKFKFLIVLAAGICIFAVQASYGIVSSITSFYLFLAAALISYLKHVYILKDSRGVNDYVRPSSIVLWSIPVSIIIILLSSQIQASDRPIQWEWLDKKVNSAYNYFRNKFDYEAFDYFSLSASSGFGDRNSLLGGRVRLDRTNVLRVTTNKRIYLRGVSKDVYTGNRWINSVEGVSLADQELDALYNDTDEMLEGIGLLTNEEDFLDKYFEENPITVTFLNLKTKSLFIPPKISELDFISDTINVYMNDTGDYSSEKRLTKDFIYNMKSYVPKIGTEEFENVLRRSKKGLYSEYLLEIVYPTYFSARTDSAEEAGENTQSEQGEFIILRIDRPSESDIYRDRRQEKLQMLKERSDLIYKKYLQIPDELPQRVKDLAASLVVSEVNDYDKAKAIERYVAGKYVYNLDVRSTPRNRDFVDYFLFDQQEGYCSYFASAMTILARCAGLPARYVEGYMLPPEPTEDRRDMYIVTNMQAHAWVEIYFEGYGWLPFEPTAPFRTTFYAVEIPEQVYYGTDYNSAYEDYMEMMMKFYGQGGTGGPLDHEPVVSKSSGLMPDIIVMVLLSSVAGLFILLLLFNMARSRFRLFRLAVMPAREAVLSHYDYYVKILRLNGLNLEPAETPHQYSFRIDKLLFFSPVRFKVITDIFVKARYSIQEVSEKEKQLFLEFVPGFLSEVRINMGKLKYFTLKYILGRI